MLVILDEFGYLYEMEWCGWMLYGNRTLFSPYLTYTHLNYNQIAENCPYYCINNKSKSLCFLPLASLWLLLQKLADFSYSDLDMDWIFRPIKWSFSLISSDSPSHPSITSQSHRVTTPKELKHSITQFHNEKIFVFDEFFDIDIRIETNQYIFLFVFMHFLFT